MNIDMAYESGSMIRKISTAGHEQRGIPPNTMSCIQLSTITVVVLLNLQLFTNEIAWGAGYLLKFFNWEKWKPHHVPD